MSTLKANYLQHPSSSAVNLTLASDGSVSGGLPTAGRNLIYNGAMQVAQRGTSTAGITTSNYYTADRWRFGVGAGTWTNSVENDAPTGSGFRKSMKILLSSAAPTVGAGTVAYFTQAFEGQDIQRIKKGTSSAEQLTLSFWVKSNKTGTYIAELYDHDNTRSVSQSYTVSASATWEKKTITFPADTTGAFDNDNGESLNLYFWLVAGSNYTSGTLATSWASTTAANRAVGQTNLAAATNNYWQVTGVQLEVGPAATPFEFESYDATLHKCQRYYYKSYNVEIAPGTASTFGALLWVQPTGTSGRNYVPYTWTHTMRTAPTVTFYNPSTGATGTANDIVLGGPIAITSAYSGQRGVGVVNNAATTATTVLAVHLVADGEL